MPAFIRSIFFCMSPTILGLFVGGLGPFEPASPWDPLDPSSSSLFIPVKSFICWFASCNSLLASSNCSLKVSLTDPQILPKKSPACSLRLSLAASASIPKKSPIRRTTSHGPSIPNFSLRGLIKCSSIALFIFWKVSVISSLIRPKNPVTFSPVLGSVFSSSSKKKL